MKVLNKKGVEFELTAEFKLPKGEYTAIGNKLDFIYDLVEPQFKGVMTKEEQKETIKNMAFRFEKNGVSVNVA